MDVHPDQDERTSRGRGAEQRTDPAAPEASPKPNFESSCPVITYSWVCASMPGVTRISTWERPAEALRPTTAPADRSRRRNPRRSSRHRANVDSSSASDLLLPCRTNGRPVLRRPAPRAVRRRSKRRSPSPPRRPGLPWPGRGTPWRRKRLFATAWLASWHRRRVLLVVDEHRCPHLTDQVEQVHPADRSRPDRSISALSGNRYRGTGAPSRPWAAPVGRR